MQTETLSLEQFYASNSIAIEERPPPRMGNAGARLYRPAVGLEGPVHVAICKNLSDRQRLWCLWHEAAHAKDCMVETRDGRLVSYSCLAGYGRISGTISRELREAEGFLTKLTPVIELWQHDGKKYTRAEFLARDDIPDSVKARKKLKALKAEFRGARYKSAVVELFAEAIACAWSILTGCGKERQDCSKRCNGSGVLKVFPFRSGASCS